MPTKIFAGIHLGVCNSCVALFPCGEEQQEQEESSDGHIPGLLSLGGYDVICNEDGDRSIPSVIAYTTDDIIIGSIAASQKARNPRNTLSHFSALIGRSFDDPVVSSVSSLESFSLVEDGDGQVAYELLDSNGNTRHLKPVQVLTDYLKQLKKAAEGYAGGELTGVVVTSSLDISDKALDELNQACTDAKILLMNVIYSPIAFLQSQLLLSSMDHDETCVVVDIGGSFSSISCVAIKSGVPVILAQKSLSDVNGASIDRKLATHFADEFLRKYKCDPRENRRSMIKLRQSAEITKKTLSNAMNGHLIAESVHEGIDFNSTLNRMRFESLVYDTISLFKRELEAFKQETLKYSPSRVYLTGGVALMPKINEIVEQVMGQCVRDTNPSESPAIGAAMEALSVYSIHNEPLKFDRKEFSGSSDGPLCFSAKKIGFKITTEEGVNRMFLLVDIGQPLPFSRILEVQPQDFDCKELVFSFYDILKGPEACIAQMKVDDYSVENMELLLEISVSTLQEVKINLKERNSGASSSLVLS